MIASSSAADNIAAALDIIPVAVKPIKQTDSGDKNKSAPVALLPYVCIETSLRYFIRPAL